MIAAALNEQDLKENIQAIYQLWVSQGAEAKKRGILSMYGIYSDDEMALLLKKQIDEWAVGMRGYCCRSCSGVGVVFIISCTYDD